MRLVIDLQSLQGTNSNRGIGRYALSLTSTLLELCRNDEVYLLLNGSLPESVNTIREAFNEKVNPENVLTFSSLEHTAGLHSENQWRQGVAELSREAYLEKISPDVVLITSLFEGVVDDTVTSIINKNKNYLTAVVLYDLIPFIAAKDYLENPGMSKWYYKKIDHLRRADMLLAISESSRQEGIKYLPFPEDKIINISTDADSNFKKLDIVNPQVLAKLNIIKPYIMYTGGIDKRKNIEGLITAYSELDESVRSDHQLVIVCSVNNESRQILNKLIHEAQLSETEVVITGYITDEELVELYNQCALFVFPSFHEGFGLPVLEAMRCGAPVICSGLTSLPEVVGLEDAMFDPKDEQQFIDLLEKGLTDLNFRDLLISHAETQQSKFSWETTARKTYDALNKLNKLNAHKSHMPVISHLLQRKKIAYVTPVQPAKSGIANYSAILLPELARYYDIDIIIKDNVPFDKVAESYSKIRNTQYLLENSDKYDRVVYQFGNSEHHDYMFPLLEKIPGVVVLHDFYISGVVQHMDVFNTHPGVWTRELLIGHGYKALRERYLENNSAEVVWRYPCSYSALSLSQGVIVHSENSVRLAKQWYGTVNPNLWSVIPHLRELPLINDKSAARKKLSISDDAFVICSFGFLGESKLNDRLIEAFAESSLYDSKECYIFFVGEMHEGDFSKKITRRITSLKITNRIQVTGWTDLDTFKDYLQAADIAVQLRSLSRGETSGAVLDCMSYGLPTIINANGTMADINPESVIMLEDKFDDESLVEALESLFKSESLRKKLSGKAIEEISTKHSLWRCAEQYSKAIENFYHPKNNFVSETLDSLFQVEGSYSEQDLDALATATAYNKGAAITYPKLLVDISELVQRDAKSGIQRVVRSILMQWLENPPEGFRVEPVYATNDRDGYHFARSFTARFLGIENVHLQDEPVDYVNGDVFVGLDLQPHITVRQEKTLSKMRALGVKINFVVYDLIPLLHSHFFVSPEDAAKDHARWLSVAANSESLICISKAVADEVEEWLRTDFQGKAKPEVKWFHLGADITNSKPSAGITGEDERILSIVNDAPAFLMVGTLEPRKNHSLALEAFDKLWREGSDAVLVIVGKEGWGVDELMQRIKAHPENNKKLFWLNNVSDEFLQRLYQESQCLIAASTAEGFGLPLIEASQNNLDIIASDIKVFKEVAQEHALYFKSDDAASLSETVLQWLSLKQSNTQPVSANLKWKTWGESAQDLLNSVIK
ncbi:glycosyltransferase [Pantoea agglomerans]|uniref:glycosyltransferase n=1 Tax=Enterobacter agglomerans TaxID=549 RepID=UPI00320A3155